MKRLDQVLVEQGFFASRSQAQAAIAAGCVSVDGTQATRPAQSVPARAVILAEPPHPWVSRAGVKLAHGLDAFGLSVAGAHCVDVGASTGGFTEVLLSRGAAHVVAVDVGRDQLHPRLRADPRVSVCEATDARSLTANELPVPPAWVVCDASFIGLLKVLPMALSLTAPEAQAVVLFKPQFEVGPAHVGKGGIVSDRIAVDRAREEVTAGLVSLGWRVAGQCESPITGGDGNREELLWLRRQP
jgi:23S rRNA (cytidine1920-2'-O)/16S rRNA (cytidine1409-2'-O)-methyltransferase